MNDDSSDERTSHEWTPHSTDGGLFYGNQIARGGGQFVGKDKVTYDLTEITRALKLTPQPPIAETTATEDAFAQAFAPLKAAAEQFPRVRPVIDLFEEELRKGDNTSDAMGAELVKVIIKTWPPALPHLRTLITQSPVKEATGATTREVIEKGGS